MNEGVYRDEFIAILDSKPPRLDEVREPFIKALAAVGQTFPDQKQAVHSIIDKHTADIAVGKVDPVDGLYQMLKESTLKGDMVSWMQRPAEEQGAEEFITLYWTIWQVEEMVYDENSGKRAEVELRKLSEEVRQAAILWQAKHGQLKEQ